MESEEYLRGLTKASSSSEDYEHYTGTPVQANPISAPKPSVKYHCYVNQTDVYSKLIGVRLPYGSAANISIQPDGSVTFANTASDPSPIRVTVYSDARVVQERLCSAASAPGCTQSVTQSSTSIESASILISTLNPKAPLAFDTQSETYQTFVSDLAAAKRTDGEDCRLYSNGCP